MNNMYNLTELFGYNSLDEMVNDCNYTSKAEALYYLLSRENVFISGPAGSGKSTLIKQFIDMIDELFDNNFNIAVTASTGLAAENIGGRTIHSWSNLGINKTFDLDDYKDWQRRKIRNLKYTDVLIIDEISMLNAYTLDALNDLLKYACGNNKPFGGIQVVLLGDFMQLPPIESKEDKANKELTTGFAFYSKVWKELNLKYCFLDKVHRAEDERLKQILNEIINKKVSQESRDLLNSRSVSKIGENKDSVKLYTTNINVDNLNRKKLEENRNDPHFFPAVLSGKEEVAKKMLKDANIPEILTLKENALVIFTKNIITEDSKGFEKSISNGTVGVVLYAGKNGITVELTDGDIVKVDYVKVEREKTDYVKSIDIKTGKETVEKVKTVEASVMFIPLKLGYAITVHKSQGQTFDNVTVDLSQCFAPGLGYVALSRVRKLDDLYIKAINDRAFIVNDDAIRATKTIKKRAAKNREEWLSYGYGECLDSDSFTRLAYLAWDIKTSGTVRYKERHMADNMPSSFEEKEVSLFENLF